MTAPSFSARNSPWLARAGRTAWLVACSCMACVAAAEEVREEVPKYRRAVLIRFEGEITPLSEQSFYRRLATARERHPDLLIVEIDSPGGWVDSSLNLADRLRQIDWARTVAFVPDEAISGAAVMSLGCDDIVMAPHAHLGDAGEIFLDEKGAFRYVEEKARSYLASRLRVLAKAKGRSPALAEAMCDMNMTVYLVRHGETRQEAYMSDQELEAAQDRDQWQKVRPVFGSREKHFLTMDGQEAVDVRFAQALAADRAELKKLYGLESQELIVLEHTALDTAVVLLNTPVLTGLLIVVGLVGLYFEFSMPGTFLGGMVAGLCLALFFWSRFLGGTAGWLELILFLAGLVFIGMELFVIPGFGVAGISGVLMLVASLIMAGQTFLVPHTTRELDTTLTQVGIVMSSLLVFVVSAMVLSRYLGAIPVARMLVLELPAPGIAEPRGEPTSGSPSSARVAGSSGLTLGAEGVADSPLRPAGKVRFGDHYLDVVSDGTFIDRGQVVRIIEISGNRVVVRALA